MEYLTPQGYTPDGIALFGKDEQSMVRFFKHPQLSKIQSEERGLPVYHDVDMIEVMQPGEKESVQVLATEWHKRRFPKQWQAFQEGIDQTMTGTPLDHLFPAEPGTILTLKSFQIHTVQQLAALSDTGINNIPMGRQMVDRAKQYLGSAEHGTEYHAMQKRIADLESKLADQGVAPEKRGPGRPPKAQGE